MKKTIIFLNIFLFSTLHAEDNLKFYIDKAIKNNIKLNAERKNLESVKQKKNISEVNFYLILQLLENKMAQLQLIE